METTHARQVKAVRDHLYLKRQNKSLTLVKGITCQLSEGVKNLRNEPFDLLLISISLNLLINDRTINEKYIKILK